MRVLTHRVLPKEAKAAKKDLAALQKARGLDASGIAGGKTFKAIKSTHLLVRDGFDRSAAKVG